MYLAGLLVGGGGTPLEPCRVAPYVSVPRLAGVPRAPPPAPLPSLAPHPPPAAFAPFDSALLSAAAHQVSLTSLVLYPRLTAFAPFSLLSTAAHQVSYSNRIVFHDRCPNPQFTLTSYL